MIFTPLELEGAYLIELDRHVDERGFFARVWCRREFEALGLDADVVQCSISHNLRKGALRGLHWQAPPNREVKVVRCVQGRMWDVIVDLRPSSATYLRHYGAELSAEEGRALYIPRGFAHGFVTLEKDTRVFYQMTEFYAPESGRGARWNDPAFGIEWPVQNPTMNERDATYPDFVPEPRR